jgi:hypothetical protein
MATGPGLAGVVQQSLPDVLPDCVTAVKADGVQPLDFDGPHAAAASDPQHVLLDLGQSLRPDGRAGRLRAGVGKRVLEYPFPVFGGIGSSGPEFGILRGSLPTTAASFSICFGVGMRQLAGRSVMPS